MLAKGRLSRYASRCARALVMSLGILSAMALLWPVDLSAQYKALYRQVVVTVSTPGVSVGPNPTWPFNPTALAIAPLPDGRLFFALVDGRIYGVVVTVVNDTLQTAGSATLYNAIHAYGVGLGQGGRVVTGIAFGPGSDLFVSHSDGRLYDSGIAQFSGRVSRLHASTSYSTYTDIVTGLPRSQRDHGPNGMVYNPADGYLYLAQAGMTNAGITGPPGDLWGFAETADSGAILKINPNLFNSYTWHATGLRNPYKPILHSNLQMYSNDNGPNPGAGVQPVGPGNCNPSGTTPSTMDELNQINPGAYYGHPNPARGQCGFNEPGHVGPVAFYGFNTSSNGLTEYISTALDALMGHIFTAHYTTNSVNSVRMVGTSPIGLGPARNGFDHPIDVVAGTPGNIFVAEFAGMGSAGVISGLRPQRTMPVDFDRDRRSDLTIFRPSTNTWHSYSPGAGGLLPGVVSGSSGIIPRPGDVDGDAKVDQITWHPSTGVWTLPHSAWGFTATVAHGGAGDIALSMDADGDTRSDQVIFRPSNGTWYVRYANTGTIIGYQWGTNGDIPRVMDVDLDGKADLAVIRPSTYDWYIVPYGSIFNPYNPATGFSRQWGGAGDIPVPADYDGDQKTDIAIFRPSTGQWWVLTSSSNWTASAVYTWGTSGDAPRPLDWDGDGRSDIVIWRPSTGVWWILLSSSNFTTSTTVWHGGPTDSAVDPAIY